MEAEFRIHHKRKVGCSWRMDETYIKVKGVWHYLYRAVDQHGKTIDFLLSVKRDQIAAKAFYSSQATLAGIELYRMLKKSQHMNEKNTMAFEQFYELAG